MNKIKLGIPKALTYYYFKNFWEVFFNELDIVLVYSNDTNKKLIENGNRIATDEMCLTLKLYLGHVNDLIGKCDYILVPRIDNYGIDQQTCTNFLALPDIVRNLFNAKILEYNINLYKNEDELTGITKMLSPLGFDNNVIEEAYYKAKKIEKKIQDNDIRKNIRTLYKKDDIKVLIISHPYNIYDEYIGKPILKLFYDNNVSLIFSDKFDQNVANRYSNLLSKDLYWKYSKDSIGSIVLCKDKIDGIVILSSFPCALDSLVNELIIRKIKLPILNLILDDADSLAGIETRIESFIDILNERKIKSY